MPQAGSSAPSLFLLVALQAIVSACSLVVEIVAGRILAPYLGMSLYTWTSIIAVVLAGFSAGHWAGGLIAERERAGALRLTAWSMAGAALSTALCVPLLRMSAGGIIEKLDNPLAAIVVVSSAVFFLPSFFAGIPAPVLSQVAVMANPGRSGRALGAMFAAGAFGAIAGTLLSGFVFIAYLGTVLTLAAVAFAYGGAAGVLFWLAGRSSRLTSVSALVGGLIVFLTAGYAARLPQPCDHESQYFCIRVIDVSQDAGTPARLMVLDHLGHGLAVRDDAQRMATPHTFMLKKIAEARMEGADHSAFFIGGGSYTLPRAWTAGPAKVLMTVAEIDPQVTQVAMSDFWYDPRATRIVHSDARMVLARESNRYDVIIGDAFTDIAVPAHLITREFFELVRERLTPDGVYLMNVIDHYNRLKALGAITRTLQDVFPSVEVWTERKRPDGDGRTVFVVVAGLQPSPVETIDGPPPEDYRIGRIPQRAVEALVRKTGTLVLRDDFAPIDRLMGRFD
ncbi:MAG: fused MFS/spermidine synthase [Rhizobiaceae bacterium]